MPFHVIFSPIEPDTLDEVEGISGGTTLIHMVNTTTEPITVEIRIDPEGDDADPLDVPVFETGLTIRPNTIEQRHPIEILTAAKVWVKASALGVNFHFMGP